MFCVLWCERVALVYLLDFFRYCPFVVFGETFEGCLIYVLGHDVVCDRGSLCFAHNVVLADIDKGGLAVVSVCGNRVEVDLVPHELLELTFFS